MPAKRSKPSKSAAKSGKAKAAGPGHGASLECAECNKGFTTSIALNDFANEVGRKFACPNCGAEYELISLLESRITVTILAKGETRTYGKTYDLSAKGYARPL